MRLYTVRDEKKQVAQVDGKNVLVINFFAPARYINIFSPECWFPLRSYCQIVRVTQNTQHCAYEITQ